jgi:hypothetical protein
MPTLLLTQGWQYWKTPIDLQFDMLIHFLVLEKFLNIEAIHSYFATKHINYSDDILQLFQLPVSTPKLMEPAGEYR